MNKIASVLYPYSPKNDDELELKVGDKIEVIGVEEEGWWKGTLKGRVGVFPSNFVQVVETESPSSTTSQNINKLNSIFGSRVGSKNSLSSSNSLNNINTNGNSNNNNNNISNSNNNLIMNNTQQQQQQQQHDVDSTNEYPFAPPAEDSLHTTNSLSERRPRPLRGIGFGDIFAQGAKTKPLPADPITRSSTAMASERLSAAANSGMDSISLGRASNTLQKQIPKKPPPPAPTDTSVTNGTSTSSDQAPALPPKPSNQFSPFLQQRPLPNPTAPQRTVREQARVIYAYKPSNDDELEMEVDDIIDIIDKNIEDAGWWKGELKGKVGVFPDNFVQLIGTQDAPVSQESSNSSRLSGSTNSNSLNNSGGIPHHHHQQQASAGSTEGKIKSVFAGTPKGFSKELESNLEKHSNPASFLSLKRNKLQQQMPPSLVGDQLQQAPNTESTGVMPTATSSLVLSDTNVRHNGHATVKQEPTSPGKLNHITANRAKGPTRRPPSNVLNKRNQLSEVSNNNSSNKYEPSDDIKEDLPPASLPAFRQATTVQPTSNHGSLSSLPGEQLPTQHLVAPNANTSPSQLNSFTPQNDLTPPSQAAMKTHSPSSNGLGDSSQTITTKTSRVNQTSTGQQVDSGKSKLNATSAVQHPSPPPWMLELRKNNAEKKRDPLPATAPGLMDEMNATSNATPTVPTPSATAATTSIAPASTPAIISTPQLPAPVPSVATPINAPQSKPNAVGTAKQIMTNHDNVMSKSDDMLKQISKTVTNEITELRNDVKKLQEDFKSILGLKEAVETMKAELRTCQSATESQRKYIKELVNNLADERKRIAAMQTEIDRNLE